MKTMYGYRACRDCGAAVQRSSMDEHECHPERWEKHQLMLGLRDLQHFESDLLAWLLTTEGRFAVYLAQRAIRGGVRA